MKEKLFYIIYFLLGAAVPVLFYSSCAQIGMPTGGPRDSLAPVLVKSVPENNLVNFTGNKITFTFNEYIEIQDVQTNLLFSPLPKTNPSVNSNLKTLTVKFRDTLRPNTTYSIDFGNAVKDVNEGNVYKNFVYTFSTGPVIDSLSLSGKVVMAETGKTDSTLMVLLYRDAPDTAITSRRPDYMARVDGDGAFQFKHLPAANFRLYALKDGDGGKFYNSKTETFAFLNQEVVTGVQIEPLALYAYAEEKATVNKTPASTPKKEAEKKLRYNINLSGIKQDLLQPFELSFNNAIANFDSTALTLQDTSYNNIANLNLTFDSTRKKLSVYHKWAPETPLIMIVGKDAFKDSSGNSLPKSDTIRFLTKGTNEYGRVVLRFSNLNLAQHPVLQFVEANAVKYSFPVTGNEWTNKMFPPGEYELRILYDNNNNGQWDPGHYPDKRQPEKAVTLPQKLSIRADWDNERDINL